MNVSLWVLNHTKYEDVEIVFRYKERVSYNVSIFFDILLNIMDEERFKERLTFSRKYMELEQILNIIDEIVVFHNINIIEGNIDIPIGVARQIYETLINHYNFTLYKTHSFDDDL